MNTKLSFLLILILLIILMLFYYIDLESNIIILLAVTILILLHNIISKKEHFNVNERSAELESKIDILLTIANALKQRTASQGSQGTGTGLAFEFSCPFNPSSDPSQQPTQVDVPSALGSNQGIDLGFGSSLDNLTPNDLVSSIQLP